MPATIPRARSLFFLLCFCCAAARAQEGMETIRPALTRPDTINTYSLDTDNNLSTFRTIGAVDYRNTFGNFSLALNELFISTVLQTDRKRITDEQMLGIDARHRLADRLRAAAKLSSLIVSDNQSLGITNLTATAFHGGVEVAPVRSIIVTPMVGMRYEYQSDQRDRGISYLLDIQSDSLYYEGYRTGIAGKWEYDNLNPRTFETRYLDLSAEKVFFDRTRNFFQFRYTRNRRDFYSPADDVVRSQFGVLNNIETRAEDAFTVSDFLDYTLNDNLFLRFQGIASARSIDRETRYRYYAGNPNPGVNTTIEEVKFEGGGEVQLSLGADFFTSLRVSYQERDEQHEALSDDSLTTAQMDQYTSTEEQRNNHSRRAWLSSVTSVALSASSSLALTASTSLLRYDTPREENDDDRDELAYILSCSFFSRLNQHFVFRLNLDANLTHLVYLPSTRSADNTWNRIFRLSPRLEYFPSNAVTTVNTFEVLANYTAYDFEYPSSPIRSFVFRQFGFNDSTSIDITSRFGIDFWGLIKLYERGELQWDQFEERPIAYFDERTYMGSVRYRLSRSLLFSVGIRYFNQSRFAYSGSERNLDQELRSIGPLTTIEWLVGRRTSFTLKGWYEDQRQTGTPDRGVVTMTMALSVRL